MNHPFLHRSDICTRLFDRERHQWVRIDEHLVHHDATSQAAYQMLDHTGKNGAFEICREVPKQNVT